MAVDGAPIAMMFCHCDDCQKVHGAAYVPEAVFEASQVNVTKGAPLTWALVRSPRYTCGVCGTRLFIDVPGRDIRGVNGWLWAGFEASFHMQCKFAVRPVVDALPHYAGRPPQFGGSDERVAW